MEDEVLKRALALMFRQTKVPENAKEKLRRRLFETRELAEDELEFVAAAGVEKTVICEGCGKEKPEGNICWDCVDEGLL